MPLSENPDDRLADLYHVRDNQDYKQLRSTVEANPHLNVTVNHLQAGFMQSGKDMDRHLSILNRAQFFQPEEFHKYATAVGEHRAKDDEKGRGSTLPPRSVVRQAHRLAEGQPPGDLREHAERLGLVNYYAESTTPLPKKTKPTSLDRGHFGIES